MELNIEPSREMVEPPKVEPVRELSTGEDGEAKQPVEDSPEPEPTPDEGDTAA